MFETFIQQTKKAFEVGHLCQYCNFKLPSRGNLMIHMKLKHKELCSSPAKKSRNNPGVDPEDSPSTETTTSRSKVLHVLPRPKTGKWIVRLQKLQF